MLTTGKGFLINRDKLVPVGGATVKIAPLRLEDFLSPDKKVWCQITSYSPSAQCGTYPNPPTWAAQLDNTGKVTLCEVLRLEYPNGAHVPAGCFQNWDTKLPVLQYGQETEAEGFRCTSAPNGITCTVVAGAGKGKGFRVSKKEAVAVG